MTFDPGPIDAFDFPPDAPPVTVPPKSRDKRPLSPAARRAIRRRAKEAEEQRARAEELQRHLDVRRHDAER